VVEHGYPIYRVSVYSHYSITLSPPLHCAGGGAALSTIGLLKELKEEAKGRDVARSQGRILSGGNPRGASPRIPFMLDLIYWQIGISFGTTARRTYRHIAPLHHRTTAPPHHRTTAPSTTRTHLYTHQAPKTASIEGLYTAEDRLTDIIIPATSKRPRYTLHLFPALSPHSLRCVGRLCRPAPFTVQIGG